jgi:EAL domain-containing protein (putative c-di-GMP-specific phosphodiesterase class I)
MTNPQRYPAVSAEYRKRHSPGLENDEFDVWYQPIVNADTLMEGVEALLRWPRRPEGRCRRMSLSASRKAAV